jgi:hypothetical protein
VLLRTSFFKPFPSSNPHPGSSLSTQGPDTDASAVSKIRAGVAEGRDTGACILNYRKDGSTFWNNFFVAALYDKDREVVNYVGVQCEVPRQLLPQV